MGLNSDRSKIIKILNRTRLAEASAFAYCLWHAYPLIDAWQKNSHDRFGWIALLIWVLPTAYGSSQRKASQRDSIPLFLTLALTLSFLGEMGSLNALKYAGLSLAFAGLTPTRLPHHIFWILTSVSWMPLIGWIGSHWFPTIIIPVRLMIAMAGSGLCLLSIQTIGKAHPCQT